MAAAAVRSQTAAVPVPRTAVDEAGVDEAAVDEAPASEAPAPEAPAPEAPPARSTAAGRAVAYQRVLHQLVRRELRMLSELATWAPPAEADRTAALTRHADLIGRVLLHHHSVERHAVWPALLRTAPAERAHQVRDAVDDWSARCARIDHLLRDVSTAARQWAVASTASARDTFSAACRTLADAVDAQTRAEEDALLPLLDEYLEPADWVAIARSSRCRLPAHEQLLVLGLALEDACATDRARLLDGLPRATRAAWWLSGGRHYRAAVVRLRGAPPAP